jgi:hypothetical protein
VRITPWLSVACTLLAAGSALPRVLPAQASDERMVGPNWAQLDDEPIAGGAVRFTLGRPGYVALFAVVPGETVRLLYPTDASQRARRFGAGSHTRATRRGFDERPRFATLSGTPPGARYLYMVASNRPLRLDAVLRWSDGELRTVARIQDRWLDPRSYDLNATLEGLFDLVVPNLDAANVEVDTDLLEYYPDVRFRRDGRVYALSAFRCHDGGLVYAPSGYGRGLALSDWYGVDFYSGRYVDASCLRGYFQPGVATGPGVQTPPGEPAGGGRLRPDAVAPNDVRPSIPLAPSELRPRSPGGPATPVAGAERMDAAPRRYRPSPHRPPRLPESHAERPYSPAAEAPGAESPRVAFPAEVRPAPQAEPPQAPAEPARAEPVPSEPARMEPARMEPARTEPPTGSVRLPLRDGEP